MAELIPAPFRDLVARLYVEAERQGAIFELPRRSWYLPTGETPNMSVAFHGRRAGNPSGPASGPHTQMAQNLVLSYLAGARIMELKTVQVMDRLEIPRPCIDMTNVGYNVEWSQELRVEDSLREYVAGMMLIEIVRRAHPAFEKKLDGPAGDVIYDISLGYDLKGIRSDKVQVYLDAMRDATAQVEKLRLQIPAQWAAARDINFPKTIATSMTLSTFHGCPTDEIERICEFLLAERGLDVIVKMNPPTLGREELEHLLHDVMGYTGVHVRPSAYTASQSFDEAVEMVSRLRRFAEARGRRFGCKFSNTLEVGNHRVFFGEENEVMYLSGLPLHVITMALTDRFRQAVGPELPISFSAGIDRENFSDAVAAGFAPITTCSDLLKPGGYGRLPGYLEKLAKEMSALGAETIDDYKLDRFGKRAEAERLAAEKGGTAADWAGWLNTSIAAESARNNERYRQEKNNREPKRIDSHLTVFDCITCNKCIPVCPNAANFTYSLPEREIEYRNFALSARGAEAGGEAMIFKTTKAMQIANFADFCNACGNCDTFCPEYGGPYIEKPGFFGSIESWEAAAPLDGFVIARGAEGGELHGRVRGDVYRLAERAEGFIFSFADGEAVFSHDIGDTVPVRTRLVAGHRSATMDTGLYLMLRSLLEGIGASSRINQVNAAHL